MRPKELLKYLSTHPLNMDECLDIIDKNYSLEQGTRIELMDWLYTRQGQRPVVVEYGARRQSERGSVEDLVGHWSAGGVRVGRHLDEDIQYGDIEYLLYGPPVGYDIQPYTYDFSRNRFLRPPIGGIRQDVIEETNPLRYVATPALHQKGWGWSADGLSSYGTLGLELEWLKIQLTTSDDWHGATETTSIMEYLEGDDYIRNLFDRQGWQITDDFGYLRLKYIGPDIVSLNYPQR